MKTNTNKNNETYATVYKMKGENNMKDIKKNIPITCVAADTDPDILALRNTLEGRDSVEVCDDGTLSVKGKHKKQGKKGDIPKGVLGVVLNPFGHHTDQTEDSADDLVSEFHAEADDADLNEVTENEQRKPGNKEKGVIPKGVLGSDNLRDMMSDTTPIQETSANENEEENEPVSAPDSKRRKALGDVPEGVLGTPQWYFRPEIKEHLAFERLMLAAVGYKG